MVFVFKTSVARKSDVKFIKPKLDGLLGCAEWTIDISDCDKVLRIEHTKDIRDRTKNMLRQHGFECEEFPL